MPRYMIYSTVKIKAGNRPAMEQVADGGAEGVSQMPGFVSQTFFLDEERSVYGATSVWESKETAEATVEAVVPGFTEAIGDLAESPIEVEVFEIYEPNA